MRTTRSQKTKGKIVPGTERLAAWTSAEKSSKGKNEQCALSIGPQRGHVT